MIVHGLGTWILDDSGMMMWTLVTLIIGLVGGALAHKLLSSATTRSAERWERIS